MIKIIDEHVFCSCGKDLGKVKDGELYCCSKCGLFLIQKEPQTKMDRFLDQYKPIQNKV